MVGKLLCMKKYFLISIFLFVVVFSCKEKKAVIDSSQLRPTSFVIDDSRVFTKSQINALNVKLRAYEEKTTNELVIITKDSIIGNNITSYSIKLGDSLGIGKKDKNNGLLILLVKPERSVRISTAIGTEKILTDSICRAIIGSKMIPHFKNGYYYQGIDEGIDELMRLWKN